MGQLVGGLGRPDLDLRALVAPGGAALGECNIDGGRVVVADDAGAADGVDERLAPSDEVVGVEGARRVARNAEASAAFACCLRRRSSVQWRPSMTLRLGVR